MDSVPITALLIGSCKCDVFRPIHDGDESENKKVDKKSGIRKTFTKRGHPIPRDAWVYGDLENMENLIARKNIDLFQTLDYYERDSSGRYSLGKRDVLRMIREFFKQDDKTHFILYFTGNGDQEGSWVFPLTTRFVKNAHKRETVRGSAVVTAADGCEGENDTGRFHEESQCASSEAEHSFIGTPTPQPTPQPEGEKSKLEVQSTDPARVTSTQAVSAESGTKTLVSVYDITRARLERPDPVRESNDLVKYEDVIELWDEYIKEGRQRHLMMILDCCHSGRWVQKVNSECQQEETNTSQAHAEMYHGKTMFKRRRDICIQASCRPAERCSIAENQLSSVFTRAFVAAQNRSTFEKFILSLLDHLFVLNIISITCSSHELTFTPISSKCAPFAGIKFFNSFDDMYLQT